MNDTALREDVPTGWLAWGVHQSFRAYIDRSGGSLTALEPAVWNEEIEQFRFPDPEAHIDGGRDCLTFEGGCRFQAHRGLLDVMLHSPSIEAAGDRLSLTIVTTWDDRLVRLEVARLELLERGDSHNENSADVTLSGHGPAWLGNVYPAGTKLDRIFWKNLSRHV